MASGGIALDLQRSVTVSLTAIALIARRPRQAVQWAAFLGGFAGAVLGLIAYLIALVLGVN